MPGYRFSVFHNFIVDLMEFHHQGHCSGGHDGVAATNKASILDCRNECVSRGSGLGYFTFSYEAKSCVCYNRADGCPDDDRHDDKSSYKITDGGM